MAHDPAEFPTRPREDPAWPSPPLVTPILAGAVLMLPVIVQVRSWARRRHPAAHRWSG
ncbi:hypothetical protein [Nocardiopsis sp. FIRDI 009]|uniref:hypothetical protein n=1 Tax=Nocardiopsis sp. FIRDI 009 TaxID=714197 RepID=UPI00130031D3|nr:hypothetical protein [Nocardiopsis sp. FIRDI 009]